MMLYLELCPFCFFLKETTSLDKTKGPLKLMPPCYHCLIGVKHVTLKVLKQLRAY